MTMQNKILAPSPRQPLNGQGVLRISGFKVAKEKVEKRLGVRFGSWNVGSIGWGGVKLVVLVKLVYNENSPTTLYYKAVKTLYLCLLKLLNVKHF